MCAYKRWLQVLGAIPKDKGMSGKRRRISTAEKRVRLWAAGEEWPLYPDGTEKLWRADDECRDGGCYKGFTAVLRDRERDREKSRTEHVCNVKGCENMACQSASGLYRPFCQSHCRAENMLRGSRAEGLRLWRQKQRDAGLCSHCRERAVPGRSLCEKHRGLKSEYDHANRTLGLPISLVRELGLDRRMRQEGLTKAVPDTTLALTSSMPRQPCRAPGPDTGR